MCLLGRSQGDRVSIDTLAGAALLRMPGVDSVLAAVAAYRDFCRGRVHPRDAFTNLGWFTTVDP